MPTPEQIAHNYRPSAEAFQKMVQPIQMDLAGEIAALRNEIAALRTELKPVPTLIVTGQQALDEFKRLIGHSA